MDFEKFGCATFFGGVVELVGHFVGGSAGATRIWKDEGGVEFECFHGGYGLGEVLVCFGWKPADYVGGNAEGADGIMFFESFAEVCDFLSVVFDSVSSVHEFENAV